MILDVCSIAVANILHRKTRGALTVLGIVIGVAAIISLVSVSEGLQESIEGQIEKFGANRIMVFPSGVGDPLSRGQSLDEKDLKAMERIAEFDYVAPWLSKNMAVEYGKEKESSVIYGIDPSLWQRISIDYALSMKEGRGFLGQEQDSIVIGSLVASDFFLQELRVHNSIVINHKKFNVIGILGSIGNPDDDNRIYMPIDTMRSLAGKASEITFLDGKVKRGYDVHGVAAKTKKMLSKDKDEESFEVSTFDQLLAQLNSILGIVQGVLLGVAGISILVGGLGIMNSMYTATLERRRDIGILKSVGATNHAIVVLFLTEAAILGMVGGVGGTVFGIAIAKFVEFYAQSAGFTFFSVSLSWWMILLGIVFAMGVGMVSGALPARQAAKLLPVEALRK